MNAFSLLTYNHAPRTANKVLPGAIIMRKYLLEIVTYFFSKI